MSSPGKKHIVISWEDLKLMGNPENAPDIEAEEEMTHFEKQKSTMALRAHYEKKGRGGKEAIIIRGFSQSKIEHLEDLCKQMKSAIGVGGSVKDWEIIIQGSQREKVMEILFKNGYKQAKKAGG